MSLQLPGLGAGTQQVLSKLCFRGEPELIGGDNNGKCSHSSHAAGHRDELC